MDAKTLVVILGWIGATGLLSAYLLLSLRVLKSGSAIFHFLNLFSSILLLINAISLEAYPFIAVNSFWCIIAIVGIVNSNKDKEQES